MNTAKKLSCAVLLAASLACGLAYRPAQAWGYAGVTVAIAPPAIPIVAQPPCPGDGYLWTPGYWAYDPVTGYTWVPGSWVLAPAVGLLWTPGYWGWGGGGWFWHGGYWGPRVGYYGGVNYGFGYFGTGYSGGYWDHGGFVYNRSYNNVGPRFAGRTFGGEGFAGHEGLAHGGFEGHALRGGAPAAHGFTRAYAPARPASAPAMRAEHPAAFRGGAHGGGSFAHAAPAPHGQPVHMAEARHGSGRGRG